MLLNLIIGTTWLQHRAAFKGTALKLQLVIKWNLIVIWFSEIFSILVALTDCQLWSDTLEVLQTIGFMALRANHELEW